MLITEHFLSCNVSVFFSSDTDRVIYGTVILGSSVAGSEEVMCGSLCPRAENFEGWFLPGVVPISGL